MSFYKTVIVVTVLSDTPLNSHMDLSLIASDIEVGDSMGTVHFGEPEALTKEQARALEIEMGGDGDFMSPFEEDWRDDQ